MSIALASMDRGGERIKPRIVQCPKCGALLHEPPPGNPFYKCGSCSTTLQAKHATQEDMLMHQKGIVKRLETNRFTKNHSSQEGTKVLYSDSSGGTPERLSDEFSFSGEGSPSWSPSRWESPVYRKIPSNHSLQRPVGSSFEEPLYSPRVIAPPVKHEIPIQTMETLGQDMRQLVFDKNEDAIHQKPACWSLSPDPSFGHAAQQRPTSMMQPHSHEMLSAIGMSSEEHQSSEPSMQDRVASSEGKQGAINKQLAVGIDQSSENAKLSLQPRPLPAPSVMRDSGQGEDLHTASRMHHCAEGSLIHHDMYAATDILDYETSEYSSTMDEADAYQGNLLDSKPQLVAADVGSLTLDQKAMGTGAFQRGLAGYSDGWSRSGRRLGGEVHEQQVASDRSTLPHQTHWVHKTVQHLSTVSSYQVQPSTLHSPRHPPLRSPPHSSHTKSCEARQGVNGSRESDVASIDGQGQVPTKPRTYPPLPGPSDAPYVVCQNCNQLLAVPSNLPPSRKWYQKLRCGACMKISVFVVRSSDSIPRVSFSDDHSPALTSSKAAAAMVNLSNAPLPPDNLRDSSARGRWAGPPSLPERGDSDRLYVQTSSGASPRLPPSVRQPSRASSGSKLSARTAAATGLAEVPVSNGLADLDSGTGIQGRGMSPQFSFFSDETPTRASNVSCVDHDMYSTAARELGNGLDRQPLQDGRVLQASSDSDSDAPKKSSYNSRPGSPIHEYSGYNSPRMLSRSAISAPQHSKDAGQETAKGLNKGLRGFLKKSVKELTKSKNAIGTSQFRRKMSVNGNAVPDAVVRRAEEHAGPIHPGSYWYDVRAGFWGVMGGPGLGMIPPFIEELNYPLARHCSGGKTGVLVNGRELHQRDLQLLMRRGLPATPGMSYSVDIDGRLMEAATGTELRGLGRLAPTLEQTGRGQGMWVPGSSKVV